MEIQLNIPVQEHLPVWMYLTEDFIAINAVQNETQMTTHLQIKKKKKKKD